MSTVEWLVYNGKQPQLVGYIGSRPIPLYTIKFIFIYYNGNTKSYYAISRTNTRR